MSGSVGTVIETHVEKRWWTPLVEFGVHSLLGTGIFAIIFSPAVGLNLLMHKVEGYRKVDPWLVYSATGAEILLVAADMILYIVFLWKTGYRAALEF